MAAAATSPLVRGQEPLFRAPSLSPPSSSTACCAAVRGVVLLRVRARCGLLAEQVLPLVHLLLGQINYIISGRISRLEKEVEEEVAAHAPPALGEPPALGDSASSLSTRKKSSICLVMPAAPLLPLALMPSSPSAAVLLGCSCIS